MVHVIKNIDIFKIIKRHQQMVMVKSDDVEGFRIIRIGGMNEKHGAYTVRALLFDRSVLPERVSGHSESASI